MGGGEGGRGGGYSEGSEGLHHLGNARGIRRI